MRSAGSSQIASGKEQPGQRFLQECWGSAQRWLTSMSAAMASKLSGEGGFKFRGVVKPLVFLCRHRALLALYHLFSRQATRTRDMLCTCSAVALHFRFELNKSDPGRSKQQHSYRRTHSKVASALLSNE